LIVEDHLDTLRALTLLISRQGYEVVPADCCRSARLAALEAPPDLVLGDITLPDGSGLELMSEIKGRLGVPTVVMSGHILPSNADELRACGADFYLVKPVDIEGVLETIRALVGRN
jgi:two-component system KDP operon response regulator KdpE